MRTSIFEGYFGNLSLGSRELLGDCSRLLEMEGGGYKWLLRCRGGGWGVETEVEFER
jgi:hypothetical protein